MPVAPELWALFAASLVGTGVPSLVHPLYAISVGYGLATAGMGATALVLFRRNLHPGNALHGLGMLLYGLRLAAFLLRRWADSSYREKKTEIDQKTLGMRTLGRLVPLVVACSLLYLSMFAPALCTLQHATFLSSLALGLPLMYSGLLLEALADEQKLAAKRTDKTSFVHSGVFASIRHPNYTGELLFWTGSWLAGLSAYATWQQGVGTVVGLAGIWTIMLQATASLAKKQEARYKDTKGWKEYCRRSGLLLPRLGVWKTE